MGTWCLPQQVNAARILSSEPLDPAARLMARKPKVRMDEPPTLSPHAAKSVLELTSAEQPLRGYVQDRVSGIAYDSTKVRQLSRNRPDDVGCGLRAEPDFDELFLEIAEDGWVKGD
jgi:hypothetical protein